MEEHGAKITKAFTHGGMFHADDVFSAALLKIVYPGITIERGNRVPQGYDGLVFDIGGGAFDHHQADKRVRANGVPYAAFGLLWEAYGSALLGCEDAAGFDLGFVQQIDLTDNTGEENLLSTCIADFYPAWNEDGSADEAFGRAVEFAGQLLDNRFRSIRAEREAYDSVRAQVERTTGGVMVLERAMPWKAAVRYSGILYVIYPSARGEYNVQAVPTEADSFLPKKPFPVPWRGKTKEELEELTGIESFLFCHTAGFLCAAGTPEAAKRIAEAAMREP